MWFLFSEVDSHVWSYQQHMLKTSVAGLQMFESGKKLWGNGPFILYCFVFSLLELVYFTYMFICWMTEAQGEEGHREGQRGRRPDLRRERHPQAHRAHELPPPRPIRPWVIYTTCLLLYHIAYFFTSDQLWRELVVVRVFWCLCNLLSGLSR